MSIEIRKPELERRLREGVKSGRFHDMDDLLTKALEEGWDTLENGALLRSAEEAGFEVLLTTDNHFAYQQNLRDRKIAILVLSRNRWRSVQRVIRKIVAAVNESEPGDYTVIDVPIR